MPQHAVKKQSAARPKNRTSTSNGSSNGSTTPSSPPISATTTTATSAATSQKSKPGSQLSLDVTDAQLEQARQLQKLNHVANVCSCQQHHHVHAEVPVVAAKQASGVVAKKAEGELESAELQSHMQETMQLSFNDPSKQDFVLPTYPVADTLALILILINFPNILVMATHLLFSYKEHVAVASSTLANPPLFMILFVDAIVVLFTAVVLPSLRNTITDISHVIIAISMSGAKWRYTFPFAAALTSARLALNKLLGLGRLPDWHLDKANWLQALIYRFGSQLTRPLRSPVALQPELSSSYSVSDTAMGSVKSAVAIHVFSLGLIRLVKYWIQSSHSPPVAASTRREESNGNGRKKRNLHQQGQPLAIIAEAKHDQRQLSIWDQFLRWRIDALDKQQDSLSHEAKPCAWVAEITPWYVALSVSIHSTDMPQVTMQVNGLRWDAKPILSAPSDLSGSGSDVTWSIYVENLSPKTEYDIALEFTEPNLGRHHFAICTSSRDTHQPKRVRGDSSLPALNTSLPNNTVLATAQPATGTAAEDPILSTDKAAHPAGPLSPMTTLEDSIAIATAKLDEKRAALKRTRKENAKKLQMLQREVDHLAQRSTGTDKTEMRMQGRMLSLQNEVKRIQESIEEMEMERQQLVAEHESQARRWQSEHDKANHETALLEAAQRAFEEARLAQNRRSTAAEQDAAKARAKADKLSLRRTKIQQDLDRLATEQDSLLSREYSDRRVEREQVRHMRLQAEADLLKSLHEMQQQADLLQTYSGHSNGTLLN